MKRDSRRCHSKRGPKTIINSISALEALEGIVVAGMESMQTKKSSSVFLCPAYRCGGAYRVRTCRNVNTRGVGAGGEEYRRRGHKLLNSFLNSRIFGAVFLDVRRKEAHAEDTAAADEHMRQARRRLLKRQNGNAAPQRPLPGQRQRKGHGQSGGAS